jgi:hypothetical protein
MTNQELRDWGWSREESQPYHNLKHTSQESMDIYRGVGAPVVQGMSLDQQLEAAKTNFRELGKTSQRLAETQMTIEEATMHLINAFGDPLKKVEEQPKVVQTCLNLFRGQAKGSELLSAYNTAWGLLNSVTEYYNHHARVVDSQSHLNSLWMGGKAQKQQQFMNQLVSVYAQ